MRDALYVMVLANESYLCFSLSGDRKTGRNISNIYTLLTSFSFLFYYFCTDSRQCGWAGRLLVFEHSGFPGWLANLFQKPTQAHLCFFNKQNPFAVYTATISGRDSIVEHDQMFEQSQYALILGHA